MRTLSMQHGQRATYGRGEMSYAGDERGERDHEVQKRPALHGEREHAARISGRLSPQTAKRVLVYRAHSHASLNSRGFSFVGMRVVENK
jgi:hypothetical protein